MSLDDLMLSLKGGAGSGNRGHGGRPGKRGGSTPKSGGGNGSESGNRSLSIYKDINNAIKNSLKNSKLSESEKPKFLKSLHSSDKKLFAAEYRKGDSEADRFVNKLITIWESKGKPSRPSRAEEARIGL